MITEDYVSFETAKLLKEKGFEVPYDSFRGVYINGVFKRLNPGDGFFHNMGDEIINVCSIQMAMKWLRKSHNLHIVIDRGSTYWNYTIRKLARFNTKDLSYNVDFNTYEEACEAAIKYCLENLI